jgi:hypothetical protein
MTKELHIIYEHIETKWEAELIIDDLIDTVFFKSNNPSYCPIKKEDIIDDYQEGDIDIVGLIPLDRKLFYQRYKRKETIHQSLMSINNNNREPFDWDKIIKV